MITISGDWFLVLLGFAVVVGVSMWLGYLLGRVRTLDPRGERRRGKPEPSPTATLAFGAVLVAGSATFLVAMLGNGWPERLDPAAVLIIAVALGLLAAGGGYLVRGVHAARAAQRAD